eukprot:4256232-Prymnesium_polylepis.1
MPAAAAGATAGAVGRFGWRRGGLQVRQRQRQRQCTRDRRAAVGLHRLYGGLPAHSLECCA